MGPDGVSFTIVVPKPWRFAPLLKLLTRTSPDAIAPPAGNPLGTNATPYGLRSPLSGMVEELTSRGINAPLIWLAEEKSIEKQMVAVKAMRHGRSKLSGLLEFLSWRLVFMVAWSPD